MREGHVSKKKRISENSRVTALFHIACVIGRLPLHLTGFCVHQFGLGSATTLTLLSERRRQVGEDDPWLFANPETGKPFTNVTFSWNSARKKAGLSDVRLHDLSHSFASFLINSGRSLYEVQRLFGTRSPLPGRPSCCQCSVNQS